MQNIFETGIKFGILVLGDIRVFLHSSLLMLSVL